MMAQDNKTNTFLCLIMASDTEDEKPFQSNGLTRQINEHYIAQNICNQFALKKTPNKYTFAARINIIQRKPAAFVLLSRS